MNFSAHKSATALFHEDHLSWTFRSQDAEGNLRFLRRYKHSFSAADRIRIERSINILRGIKHPQIPALIDSSTETIDGLELLSLELEWVEGTLLQQVVAAQRPTLDTIIAWCASLLSLLEYLHGLQPPVLHRDLRPGNLLIGGDGRLHLTGFWLAVDGIEHSLGHSLMEDGSVYRAPEEVAGQPSSKSDIYSVGVLLVELVTGNAASQLRDAFGLLRWQNDCRTLPLWLQHWLDAVLDPDPSRRPSAVQARRRLLNPATESDLPSAAHPPARVMQLLEEAIAAKHSRDQAVSSLVHNSQRQLQRNQQEWKNNEIQLHSAIEQAWDRLSAAAHADEISAAEGRALLQQLFGQPRRSRAHHDPRVDVLLKAAASSPQRPLLRRCCWELVRWVCQRHAHTELLSLLDEVERNNSWWQRHNNDPNALLPTEISRQRLQQLEQLCGLLSEAVGHHLALVAWPKGGFDEELIDALRSNQLERRQEGRSQLVFGLFLCLFLLWVLSLFV